MMVSYFFQHLGINSKIKFGIFQKFAMITLELNNIQSMGICKIRLAFIAYKGIQSNQNRA